jgi:hypothetical protein
MVFDLVILLLCTWRLRSSRKHGGIATLLIRDGIVSLYCNFRPSINLSARQQGYFCAAFGANLIQTVMASLHYNPVFSIMCLPMGRSFTLRTVCKHLSTSLCSARRLRHRRNDRVPQRLHGAQRLALRRYLRPHWSPFLERRSRRLRCRGRAHTAWRHLLARRAKQRIWGQYRARRASKRA